jgi:uncharacterized protein (DUF736 family)
MSDYVYKPYKDGGKLNASKSKKSDKSPDYWGDIAINLKDLNNVQVVDGLHVFKLSGWKKISKSGNTFLSVAIDRREVEATSNTPATPDEDIPFN